MILPLPLYSTYSFHYGTIQPRNLVAAAKRLGYGTLALTDREGLFGLPTFLEAAREGGIRPIVGVELGYGTGKGGERDSCILLVKDRGGFSRLSRLLTERKGCAAGPLGSEAARPDGKTRSAEAASHPSLGREGLAAWIEARGEGLVALSEDPALVALWRGRADRYALLRGGARPAWKGLLALGVPPVAGAEVAFLAGGREAQDERELQRLLVAIGRLATVWDVGEGELSPPGAILRSPEEAALPWANLPEALANNEAVAEACRFDNLFQGWRFPAWPTDQPGGSQGLLRDLALEGLGWRLGRDAVPDTESMEAAPAVEIAPTAPRVEAAPALRGTASNSRQASLPPTYLARLDYELGIIGEKGFADYFLVVKDIVRRSPRTCGRGSAAASLVSWALGITDVDPIAHDLYFERFLNPGRMDPPDIDVDFAWDERDELIASVIEAYGEAHAARVANHVTFGSRGALRETARAFGMGDREIGLFEGRLARAEASAGADEPWRRIAALAEGIVGFPRNVGVHSGGLVVVPDELCEIVPLVRSGGGIRVVAWDKEGIEAAGLVKIDLLGNRSLAVVRDSWINIEANRPRRPAPADREASDDYACESDPATIDLLARGDTMGVFYVESPAMRLLQRKTGAGDFAHLVIHSSMIRPAANRYINEYIDRLHGKEWKPLHPLLAGILDETCGLMCYQEDVSKVAVALAGFTPAEADGMRKVLSKKDAVTRLESFRPKFEAGARDRGVDEATIGASWDMICSFAGYSFVKAHSASYARLSFRSAWLRAHHPAEFMAAVMSNRGGYYTILAYSSEARRMGLRLLAPSVDQSDLRSRGSGRDIRFGLGLIAGLGEATARRIVEERSRRGPYGDIDEFARRIDPDRDDAEALVESGALDDLAPGLRRSTLLMRLLRHSALREVSTSLGPGLFDLSGVVEPAGLAFSKAGGRRDPGGRGEEAQGATSGSAREPPRESPRSRLLSELRRLGTTLEVHPLALWPEALAAKRCLAKDLGDHVGERVRILGWPVTAKEVMAKGEQPMEFVSFEDETALVEVVLFPEAYRRFGGLLFEERPFFISGKVALDRGGLTLELLRLEGIPEGGSGPDRSGSAFHVFEGRGHEFPALR